MKHKCDQCHIIAVNETELNNHIATTHNGISLHDLFTSQNDVKCMISDLKLQLSSSFSTISDDLNKLKEENISLKQELFIVRQKVEISKITEVPSVKEPVLRGYPTHVSPNRGHLNDNDESPVILPNCTEPQRKST